MANKQGCGNCGKSGGCGCKTTNPYEASVKAVWHDPTSYDMLKHGPSFFPGMKLSHSQKTEVTKFREKRAGFDSPPVPGWQEAKRLLAFLRAASFIHQTNHWQTAGQSFYGDHLLYQHIYEESSKGIDELAERIVGSIGTGHVDAQPQAKAVGMTVDYIYSQAAQPSVLELSITAEVIVLLAVKRSIAGLEAAQALTPGTSNLLEGLFDKHETFLYLLKQRLTS